MNFFTDFNPTLQDILEKVGQKAGLKGVEKGAKSKCLEFRDRLKKLIPQRTLIKNLRDKSLTGYAAHIFFLRKGGPRAV